MLKAVIFDVGGVLIVTENWRGREKWAARLQMNPAEFEDFVFNGESGRLSQLGQKSWAEHWTYLGKHFDLSITELGEMQRDFFIGDVINKPMVAYIERLKLAGQFKLGILSNFGDNARRLWTESYPFLQYFKGVIISSEVGLMKPEPQIYRLAAESVQVALEEAVFVDDFEKNVVGARQVGMQAIHFTETEAVINQLQVLTGVM